MFNLSWQLEKGFFFRISCRICIDASYFFFSSTFGCRIPRSHIHTHMFVQRDGFILFSVWSSLLREACTCKPFFLLRHSLFLYIRCFHRDEKGVFVCILIPGFYVLAVAKLARKKKGERCLRSGFGIDDSNDDDVGNWIYTNWLLRHTRRLVYKEPGPE
jgi:hypothetical protein